jgi:hypothetical protein
MSKIYTYREITYELRDTQGFYYCLVYAEGESTALFQTKFFASADNATSAAISFIDDYNSFRKTKEEKRRIRRSKPNEGKSKPLISESKHEIGKPPISKPKVEEIKPERTKPLEDESRSSSAPVEKDWTFGSRSVEMGQAIKRLWPHESESKPQHSSIAIPNRKVAILLLIIIIGVVFVVTTIIVDRNSGFFQSILGRGQVRSTTTPTVSPESGFSLPAPRATIALPEFSPSPTYTPTAIMTATATVTVTITPTLTTFPTQPSKIPTNTPRPTNPPIPTSTFTPTPTMTITPTYTPTATPAPPTLGPPPSPQATPPTQGA